jgi:hypothetical protein
LSGDEKTGTKRETSKSPLQRLLDGCLHQDLSTSRCPTITEHLEKGSTLKVEVLKKLYLSNRLKIEASEEGVAELSVKFLDKLEILLIQRI